MKLRPVSYLDVIAGRDRSLDGYLLRPLLSALTLPYRLATELRNRSYDRGWLRTHSVPAPVISIGNLTTGGTGKTPAVAWMVHQLASLGLRPAIVSRGYRSPGQEGNDEKRLLDSLCPGVPHVQDADRLTACRQVLMTTDANVIVLDDGFQHRRLHRDLDLVLIDAVNPWGYGRLLPRGLLRERIGNLRRADALLITRCDLAAESQVSRIEQCVRRSSQAPIFRTTFTPVQWVNTHHETRPLESFVDQSAFAFCGIGNPSGFRRTLAALGLGVPDECCLTFPDHCPYRVSDLDQIARHAQRAGAQVLLTTCKDLVKIPWEEIGNIPLWALEVDLAFLDSAEPLLEMLRAINVKSLAETGANGENREML